MGVDVSLGFQRVGAIVFSDPSCRAAPDRLDVADATADTWSRAMSGSVVVNGTDPVFHADRGIERGPAPDPIDTLAYVTRGAGTGLAVSLHCYFSGAELVDTPVTLLRHFGTFTVQGQGTDPSTLPEKVETQILLHPLLAGLPAADLSDWSCSIHEAFDSMPSGFDVIAQHRRSDAVHHHGKGGEFLSVVCADQVLDLTCLVVSQPSSLNRKTRALAERGGRPCHSRPRSEGSMALSLEGGIVANPRAAETLASRPSLATWNGAGQFPADLGAEAHRDRSGRGHPTGSVAIRSLARRR